MRARLLWALPLVFLLGACVSMPTGPSVMVLPGPHKTFADFRADNVACREFASQSIGGASAARAGANSAAASAIAGTAIGATAGALIGGRQGAAVGAGSGLLIGSAAGSQSAGASAYGAQRRYDIAYMQCMYAKGNTIPSGWGYYNNSGPGGPAAYPPPPYEGYPPPPE